MPNPATCPPEGCTKVQLIVQAQTHYREVIDDFSSRMLQSADKFQQAVDAHSEIITRFDERLKAGHLRFEALESRTQSLEQSPRGDGASKVKVALFSGSGGMALWALGEKFVAWLLKSS